MNGQSLKIICILCLSSLLAACDLPPNQFTHIAEFNHSATTHSETIRQTHLSEHEMQIEQEKIQQGLSRYLTLEDPFTSISARLYLIRQAKQQIDIQYYIWKNDDIGRFILSELLNAAERGVKVRLMLDDQNGNQLDDMLSRLADHPNIDIALFNPYRYRNARYMDFALRALTINHRMHNKLMIVDQSLALTGGRNISREYFDASDQFQFSDMDVLFLGASIQSAQTLFESFWSHELSFDFQQLVPKHKRYSIAEIKQYFQQPDQMNDEERQQIHEALNALSEQFKKTDRPWVKAKFYGDHPDKALGAVDQEQLLIYHLQQEMIHPKQHIELVSAYFVPGKHGTTFLTDLAKQGQHVRVLTNSLAANDVALVHAYYAKYRKELLQKGIKLYEFKPFLERERTWYEKFTGNVISPDRRQRSSLHAKFFDIDGKVFIGSFNFDPRSAYLNTEVGLIIEDDQLQDQISEALDRYLPTIAYQLSLDQNNNIQWIEHHADGSQTVHQHDPETTSFQRTILYMIGFLPFEWLM